MSTLLSVGIKADISFTNTLPRAQLCSAARRIGLATIEWGLFGKCLVDIGRLMGIEAQFSVT